MRKWVTPLVTGVFIITAATGGLLFFHLEPGIVEPVHKWSGWLVLVAAVLHVVVHWRSFFGYLKTVPGFSIIAAGVAVVLLSLYPWVDKEEHPARKVLAAVEDASLVDSAPIFGLSMQELTERLKQGGVIVYDPQASLEETAERNGRKTGELLKIIVQ